MDKLGINFKSTSDGWRGKLAENFTFANVERLAKAIVLYLQMETNQRKIVIGYDTRFMSKEFALFISGIMQTNGIGVLLISNPTTTPLLAFATHLYKVPLGLNVTASHNPPQDDGVKIRMEYGGTPNKEVIEKIESYFDFEVPISKSKGLLEEINPIPAYVDQLRNFIDLKDAKNIKTRVLVDTMHGAANGLLGFVLDGTGIDVDYLHADFDPLFGGTNPEPKFESTQELQDKVSSGKYNFGIAHDGDGDRIVAALPGIGYLSPHEVSALLVLYLAKYRGLKGKVMGSSTLGRRVKKVCEHLGLVYEVMPVGFKNATESLLKGEVLIAAEENGGVGFGFYLPEREVTLAASILVEAEIKQGLKNLMSELEQIAGKSGFCRFNYKPSCNRKTLFQEIVKNSNIFAFKEIESIDYLDGVKIIFVNGDWLSLRFSGTEDIIRIYCESDTREKATEIKNFAISQINKLEK